MVRRAKLSLYLAVSDVRETGPAQSSSATVRNYCANGGPRQWPGDQESINRCRVRSRNGGFPSRAAAIVGPKESARLVFGEPGETGEATYARFPTCWRCAEKESKGQARPHVGP
jgi:hypothetical protein